ncbi:MAG: hypothetical protein A2Z21_06995 [Candidatus Fraserbacteria bacterium RBG_16_55_9]|uniref:HAD family hydrolase n=1 Tax=Fraserbacteria sp. (strain RBG_16_55_9) TaxID=1817864 RepID=A0A1F5UQI5_FRAXR|nr:MAG: hypothetical protein A2Z21_06995 [Candidatus Fraserbacteria bacterium RBG_16_55_9]
MLRKLLPDERRDSVYQLDLEALWARGARGIIFDFDNTLGPWGFAQLDEQALRWLKTVQTRGFRVGFLSNHRGEGREGLLASLDGHPVVFNAGKPRPSGYRSLLEKLDLPLRQVIMVGDQIFTDIWGAKRLGLYTVLVRPVAPEREGPFVRVRRLLERLLLRW